MGYKKTSTNCTVQIIALSIGKQQSEQCKVLRQEAGKCWTEVVTTHLKSRETNCWINEGNLKKQVANKYNLYSQTVQALVEKFFANLQTATELRKQELKETGKITTEYPYHSKEYQNVTWKLECIRMIDGKLHLSNGKRSSPLVLTLPVKYRTQKIKTAELGWKADHYELYLTIDTEVTDAPPIQRVATAGIDLGEINIAAVVTDKGEGINISGRYLRSLKRLRNKRHSTISEKLKQCKKDSVRHKRLLRSKSRASAKFERQQRDILHKASRQVVTFCKQQNIAKIAIGDVRYIADEVNLGDNNQKISQWSHGQMVNYVKYKSRLYGMSTKQIPEDYSSRTCSVCGHCNNHSPSGRVFKCSECGAIISRDGNGAANICSRARYGEYGKVQVQNLTYLQPIDIGCSRPTEPMGCCSNTVVANNEAIQN
jgi:putative transposase